LSPVLRFYQLLLYPVAKPTSLLLDKWLGAEATHYVKEKDLREILQIHVDSPDTEIDRMEGQGALNFLALDDLSITDEGEPVDPDSIIQLEFHGNRPVFPRIESSCDDPFLRRIHEGNKKWIILTNGDGEPKLTFDSGEFLSAALFAKSSFHPMDFCHRPVVIHDAESRLGEAISQLKVQPEAPGDDVIDEDIILFWGGSKRIITGSDILGRLLRGVVQHRGTAQAGH
jgi:hypothetical protein